MKLMKWLLGLLITLVVLIVAAVVVLPKVVDPNDYREQIADIVKQQTGRDLTIDGDLSLSVFPWLGVSTGKVTVSQPNHLSEDFGGDNMLEVEATDVKVKALPLIKSLLSGPLDIRVATVVLKQPRVQLITTADGVSSFDGLAGEGDAAEPAAQAQEDKQVAAGAGLALVVQGVDLQGGNLVWDDRQAGQRYEVKDFKLVTGNLLGGSLAPLLVSGQVLDSSHPDPANFELEGRARLDVNTLKLVAENLKLSADRGTFGANLTINDINFVQNGLINIGNFNARVNIEDEQIGPANLQMLVPTLDFDQSSGDLTVDKIVANGAYQQRPINLEGTNFRFGMNSQRLVLQELNIVSDDINAALSNVNGTSMIDDPKINGELDVRPFDAQALLKSLAIDYQPQADNAMKKVSFASAFSGGLNAVELKRLKAVLDESELVGDLSVSNFAQPTATFALQLNSLNLDNYLPKSEGSESEPAQSESTGSSGVDTSALVVPMALFKQYKANGELAIGQLVASGAKVDDIRVAVASTDNTTTITPSASLYSGKFDGEVKFQGAVDGGTLSVKKALTGIDLGALLIDTDITDRLSGSGSLDVDVAIREKNGQQTNSGVIKLGARDGALKGVDIVGILRRAQEKLGQGSPAEGDGKGVGNASDETKFAEMSGSFNLKQFVLTNNDFSMKAPLFRVGGAGTVDIEKSALDYETGVSVVSSLEGQGGADLDKLAGVTIPIRFHGKFDAVEYDVDYGKLFKSLVKKQGQEKIDQKKDAILDKAKKKYGLDLKGLLK